MSHCTAWIHLPLASLALAVTVVASPARAADEAMELFAVSDAVRVFEDGYACPEPGKKIELLGLRGETVSAQCVVRAKEDLEGVSAAIGPVKSEGGAVLAAENVGWNLVEGIAIEKNTPKVLKSDLIRPAPARFPDCLGEARQCMVKKGSLKAIYWTIRIPRDAQPGTYQAEIAVSAGAKRSVLPLTLQVVPLVLPQQRHVLVSEWYSTHQFQKHHGIDPKDVEARYRMLRVYAENMAEHRQNVFQVSLHLIRTTRAADGKLRCDFSEFDRMAQVFWDTGRMDRLETGAVAHFGKVNGKEGWGSTEILLSDGWVRDDTTGKSIKLPAKEYLPQFLPLVVAHLKEKNWLDKTVLHIADEPSNHNVMPWREASDFVHRCAPELRRIEAIETTHFDNRLEVWVPKLDHLATWQQAYEAAQRRGNELWFYTVGIFQAGSTPNKTVDVPLVESRLMHWLNYRFGVAGYLHWGYNHWTDDPWNAPGEHRGDGWHVYPKKGGLLNSLRWEQMRNGLQDYECLWLLEDAIAKIKAAQSPRVAELIQPRQRGIEIASQVVRGYSDYQRDPAVLHAARRQAIEETLALECSPRVIFQTNPYEHEAVPNNSNLDVYGWAEPGTQIKLNGREIPVADDGLFLAEMTASREGKITLEAKRGTAQKTIVRSFRLMYPVPARK